MHTLRNRILFFGVTGAAGLASLMLHNYMMDNCFDAKGLLIDGNLPGRLLWVVGIGFAVFLALMLRTIGGEGSYEDNFPPCLLSSCLMLAAGAVLYWAIPELVLEAGESVPGVTGLPLLVQNITDRAVQYLPWAAAASMGVLGICRMLGRKPWPILSGAVCLFYMLMLVTNYRLWSADPQLHTYCFQLLAMVLLLLCSFHRTCCDAGVIQRKRLIATGLCAAVCCMASLSGGFQRGFFLASGLWAAGCLCNVAQLPPDPEEEEEESPEQPEEPAVEAENTPDPLA